MKTITINGFYGSQETPCKVFTAHTSRGTWYCVEDSKLVNFTNQELFDGVNVELVQDVDCFTWSCGILSEEQLIEAIEA